MRKPIWACDCGKTKKVRIVDISPPLCTNCLLPMLSSYVEEANLSIDLNKAMKQCDHCESDTKKED